jgi:hypothetical protein
METQQEGNNNDQLIIHQHNNNIDIDIDINLNKKRSRYQQKYFKLCGKTRRLPDKEGIIGIAMSICFYLCGTTFYEIMCISLIISNKHNNDFSTTGYYVVAIVGIITFIITQLSYFDITTSIPGYQTSNRLTEDEYKRAPPVKVIQDKSFTLKYCSTCKIARDVRTFHCRYCNMCIERHDHHCGYVSNCIGKNNTKKFFYFLIAACVHCLLVVGMCFYTFISVYIEINMLDQNNEVGFYTVICGVLIIFVGFFLIFIITMICTHVSLISKNQTTNEEIRKKYNNSIFDKGTRENCKEVFCVQEDVFIPEEWQLEKGELIIK